MMNRILIALCQMAMLKHCGKDMDRADDFSLVEGIARSGRIPSSWPGGDDEPPQAVPREKVRIIARNYREAEDFAHVKNLPSSDWIYVSSPQHLYGLRHPTVYRIGNWFELRDSSALETLLLSREAKVIDIPDWRGPNAPSPLP